MLQEFRDVFPDEVPKLPTKGDVDITIELVSGAAPMSKTPYRVSTPDLLELKMQLQELWERSISGQVCPSGEHRFGLIKRNMVHASYGLITDS